MEPKERALKPQCGTRTQTESKKKKKSLHERYTTFTPFSLELFTLYNLDNETTRQPFALLITTHQPELLILLFIYCATKRKVGDWWINIFWSYAYQKYIYIYIDLIKKKKKLVNFDWLVKEKWREEIDDIGNAKIWSHVNDTHVFLGRKKNIG